MASPFVAGRLYRGRIVRWALTEARTGTPQFAVTCRVVGEVGPDGEATPVPQEAERTVFRPITENAIDYLVEDLKKLGYDRDSFDALDPGHPDAFDFAGREVGLRMRLETYQGAQAEKWAFAWAAADLKPIDRAGLARLNALFGKKLQAGARPAAKPARPQPAPRAAAADEAPF